MLSSPPQRKMALRKRATRKGLSLLIANPHVGVDEAGRGCLAGPVVAGAVLLRPGVSVRRILPGLDDSKKLTPEIRASLAVRIRAKAVAYGVGLAWQREIDQVNILNATFRAMSRAVLALYVRWRRSGCGDAALPLLCIDGDKTIPEPHWLYCLQKRQVPVLWLMTEDRGEQSSDAGSGDDAGLALSGYPVFGRAPSQQAIIGGDALVPAISAASILAKTTRDALMEHLDRRYPGYEFARHKGYGTEAHQAALAAKGACRLHRLTFRGVLPEPEQLTLF